MVSPASGVGYRTGMRNLSRGGGNARENLAVSRCDATRLRKVRLRNGEPVPFLTDVLDLIRGAVPVNIESKTDGGIPASLRVIGGGRGGGGGLLSSGRGSGGD